MNQIEGFLNILMAYIRAKGRVDMESFALFVQDREGNAKLLDELNKHVKFFGGSIGVFTRRDKPDDYGGCGDPYTDHMPRKSIDDGDCPHCDSNCGGDCDSKPSPFGDIV